MRLVIDIEANALHNPTKIWVIICKDIDKGDYYVFKNVTSDLAEAQRFVDLASKAEEYIGHNWCGYDLPHLGRLLRVPVSDWASRSTDTLIVSKLANYSRKSHALESYGEEFGLEKGIPIGDYLLPSAHFPVHIFSKWSQDLEDYCKRDVDITHRVYTKYTKYINNHTNRDGILLEQWFQLVVVNDLSNNGFSFNVKKAKGYLDKVEKDLIVLDEAILREFLPKQVLVREFTPRLTKYGTLSKTSVPRSLWHRISDFEAGTTYPVYRTAEFNPASHKQIVDVLHEAGWKPVNRTKTAIEDERELVKLRYQKEKSPGVDLQIQLLYTKIENQKKYGWKIDETNLSTLPEGAPSAARTLAKRILLESRRRTLTEWLGLVQEDGRIHGKFYGIGAWTHRMAHQAPNTANIPNEFDTAGNRKLLGKEMRSLWQAPRNRLLVGVDAEGIQLRVFAHYIDDPEFTEALVNGKKEDKSDAHSLNQRVLGSVCKSRSAAKRFIYALLLGAGTGKLSEILGCDESSTQDALARLMERYQGFSELKRTLIPRDARRGWFHGLDGRQVPIPGETVGLRGHLCMSGYLQNGEAVIMKRATKRWYEQLNDIKDSWIIVNFVHDEWQTETENNMEIALKVAKAQADSLREVGEDLGLKCPLAGSYYNEDLKDYTIATNWAYTH